jgi:hypothetical protein
MCDHDRPLYLIKYRTSSAAGICCRVSVSWNKHGQRVFLQVLAHNYNNNFLRSITVNSYNGPDRTNSRRPRGENGRVRIFGLPLLGPFAVRTADGPKRTADGSPSCRFLVGLGPTKCRSERFILHVLRAVAPGPGSSRTGHD